MVNLLAQMVMAEASEASQSRTYHVQTRKSIAAVVKVATENKYARYILCEMATEIVGDQGTAGAWG